VAFGVLDFIHTNGADRLQRAMLQAPADHILDGVAHLVPGSVERFGGFLPGELTRPASQKQHVGSSQLVLAIAPGNLLDDHAAVPALDAPHAVQQEHQKAPQWDELEAPLGKVIVTRCRLVAPRTDCRRDHPPPDVHFYSLLVGRERGGVGGGGGKTPPVGLWKYFKILINSRGGTFLKAKTAQVNRAATAASAYCH